MKKPVMLLLVICISYIYADEQDAAEDGNMHNDSPIETFGNRFSIGMNAKYNFLVFNDGNITTSSNTPVFLGVSFGYKDYSFFASVAQTYTYMPSIGAHPTFDAVLGFYQERWIEELSFKFYDDFKMEDEPFNLRYISFNLSGRYIFNYENFSLRSVFPMNRLQRYSAGSLIGGGNLRVFSIKSGEIERFNARRWYVNIGPNTGYSYTFVTTTFFFINLYVFGGINFGFEVVKPEFVFSAFINPKITFGRHFKTWSFNFVIDVDYSIFVSNNRQYESFIYAAAAPEVLKRF